MRNGKSINLESWGDGMELSRSPEEVNKDGVWKGDGTGGKLQDAAGHRRQMPKRELGLDFRCGGHRSVD